MMRLWRRYCVAASVVAMLAWAMPAFGQADIEVRLVPTLTPGTSTTAPNPGPDVLDIEPNDSFSVEFWISDLDNGGDPPVTGISSAFINLAWVETAPASADALTLNYMNPPWGFMTAGTVDNPGNVVTNYGAGDITFAGQGQGEFSLVGYVDYLAGPELGAIDFSATEGIDEIAPKDRAAGDILFVGGTVRVVPEPGSLALLGLAGLVCMRRRRA